MQRSFRGRRREQSEGQRPARRKRSAPEARLGNGPVDRFRAERAEPKALPGVSPGGAFVGRYSPMQRSF